jgi:hypothetical protein
MSEWEPTMNLRYVPATPWKYSSTPPPKLQQQWRNRSSDLEYEYEWRDVPIETTPSRGGVR